MNREDIIRMAREAGLDIDSWEPLYEGGLTGFGVYECTHEELERFAALVASAAQAKEREACAQVCDDKGMFHEVSQGADLAFELAAAIRARGQA